MAEETVARYPNLALRNGTFYLRLRVPKDLTADLGKTHIVRSLRTKDRSVAVGRYRTENGRIEREFAAARKQRDAVAVVRGSLASGRLDKLTAVEVEAIAIRWFEQAVQHVACDRDDPHATSDVDWDAVLEDVQQTESILTSPRQEDHAQYVENVAGQILVAAGAPIAATGTSRIRRANPIPQIDRDSSQYCQLLGLVRRGLTAINRQRFSSLTGAPVRANDPLFTASGARPQEKPKRTLDDLITAYQSDPGRFGRTGAMSFDYGFVFSALREVLGADADVTQIGREDVKRLRDLLISLPPNATKRFPGKKLTQIAEIISHQDFKKLRTKTVNEHISKIAALFNWAARESWIERNPAAKLIIARNDDSTLREPFSKEQLSAIFLAPIYTGCKNDENGYAVAGSSHPRRSRFWIPLLSLLHGLRLNEAAQLRTDDVVERDGIAVILVRAAAAEQRVKTRAATRVVPLHPDIISFGFLGFVSRSREAGEARLFPELRRDKRGYHSDAFQKYFARFLHSCGAAKAGTTFHSFRHGWADRLREAGVPEDRRRALGGWADTGVDAGYGRGFPTKMLAADIAAVTYPGLSLEHLR